MLALSKPNADCLIPDNAAPDVALSRTTHLAIGAHQDDLEMMAYHGILACFGQTDQWFTGVTCTDGAGSPRAGVYANHTDEAMRAIRREEQRTAARLGRYAAMLQLEHASREIKDPANRAPVNDLVAILSATRPRIVYTHNPADKHPTHVAVMRATLAALRQLPADARPDKVYGCEVWRDLDWLPDDAKILLDVSGNEELASALVAIFDSQVSGGKRYDLATLGRRRANATYYASHGVDTCTAATYALDLTPFMLDPKRDVFDHVAGLLDNLKAQILANRA